MSNYPSKDNKHPPATESLCPSTALFLDLVSLTFSFTFFLGNSFSLVKKTRSPKISGVLYSPLPNANRRRLQWRLRRRTAPTGSSIWDLKTFLCPAPTSLLLNPDFNGLLMLSPFPPLLGLSILSNFSNSSKILLEFASRILGLRNQMVFL